MAAIVIWTVAANWVRRRSNCDEPAAGTHFLDDDRGGPIREDEDVGLLGCGTVGWDLHVAP